MRSPTMATRRPIWRTLRRPRESANRPVEMAVAASASVEMLAAKDVLAMSRPRARLAAIADASVQPEP